MKLIRFIFFTSILVLSSCSDYNDNRNEILESHGNQTCLLNFDNSEFGYSNITIENIGDIHNQLVLEYYKEMGLIDNLNSIDNYFRNKISFTQELNASEIQNEISSLYEFIHNEQMVTVNLEMSEQEISFFNSILNVVLEAKDVTKTKNNLDLIQQNIQFLEEDRRIVFELAIAIGKSSYELWAPVSLGGLGLHDCLEDILEEQEELVRPRNFGSWFAVTASADITGGLAAAGRTAWTLVVPGWGVGALLSSGAWGAAVSSTYAGITNSGDARDCP